MNYKVLISDEALFDISEAMYWYEAQHPGLEIKFLSEIKSGIEYVSKAPYNI